MRRGRREMIDKRTTNVRYLFWLFLGSILVMLLTFIVTFNVYTNKIKESNYSVLTTEKIAELIPNDSTNVELEQASMDIGKNIEEVIASVEQNIKEASENEEIKHVSEENKEAVPTNIEPEVVKEPEFIMPVEGEVTVGFAKDSLIYSETLEEWIVHLGIDIKANRATVVKAAEDGRVVAIKNDPRYGLTIVIEHGNGYKTIYPTIPKNKILAIEIKSSGTFRRIILLLNLIFSILTPPL